uniref:Protein kinase domain-containing protein n=1 Tax=Oryza rufipogon TaxID=4529 RepID=A0A0E0R3I9_ORYRU
MPRTSPYTRYVIDFTLFELETITKNFRADYVLGEGGFGTVYKGYIDENVRVSLKSLPVAVKFPRLAPPSGLVGNREEREREDVHTGSGGEDRRSGGPAILADCDPRCAAAHSAPPSAPTATCATPPPAYRFAVGPAKLYRCSIVTLLAPPCPVVPPHHPLRSHRLPFASRG